MGGALDFIENIEKDFEIQSVIKDKYMLQIHCMMKNYSKALAICLSKIEWNQNNIDHINEYIGVSQLIDPNLQRFDLVCTLMDKFPDSTLLKSYYLIVFNVDEHKNSEMFEKFTMILDSYIKEQKSGLLVSFIDNVSADKKKIDILLDVLDSNIDSKSISKSFYLQIKYSVYKNVHAELSKVISEFENLTPENDSHLMLKLRKCAKFYYLYGDLEKATGLLEMAFKRFPGNKFLCTQLCKCYIRSGRIDDALKEYANFTICADNFKPDVYFEKIQYSGFPYMTMWYYLSEQNFAKCLESCIGILDIAKDFRDSLYDFYLISVNHSSTNQMISGYDQSNGHFQANHSINACGIGLKICLALKKKKIIIKKNLELPKRAHAENLDILIDDFAKGLIKAAEISPSLHRIIFDYYLCIGNKTCAQRSLNILKKYPTLAENYSIGTLEKIINSDDQTCIDELMSSMHINPPKNYSKLYMINLLMQNQPLKSEYSAFYQYFQSNKSILESKISYLVNANKTLEIA